MEHPRPLPIPIDDLLHGLFIELSDSETASSDDLPHASEYVDPLPFADAGEDSDPPVRIRRGSDPLNPHALDYDWPHLSQVDREIFGPERV